MSLIRMFLLPLLVLGGTNCWATSHPRPRTVAETEARNETGVPGFAGQVREARRITTFLLDALVLSHAQHQALEARTVAERAALALAATEAEATQVQRQYQLAVLKVLTTSQLRVYMELSRQLAGTLLPLDGTELASR